MLMREIEVAIYIYMYMYNPNYEHYFSVET
jgi:hypothetical protein